MPVSFTAASAPTSPVIERDLGAVCIGVEHWTDPAYVAALGPCVRVRFNCEQTSETTEARSAIG